MIFNWLIRKFRKSAHDVEIKTEEEHSPSTESVTVSAKSDSEKQPEIEPSAEFYEVREELLRGTKYIFVSGGAGTGKTTLIGWLRSQGLVDAIVAPTGIAALNADGMTIHSFFGIAPGLPPDRRPECRIKRENYRLIEKGHVLVIDEISMVRADLLDTVLEFCNKVNPKLQYLFVGDLFQLPPVVENRYKHFFDETSPSHLWNSKWFFSANELYGHVQTICLTKCYRQAQKDFIRLLNDLREYRNVPEAINFFNLNCKKGTNPKAVMLTSLTADAEAKNKRELGKLPGPCFFSQAVIEGDWGINDRFPAPDILRLKPGALVMFLVNEPSRVYVNGTLGIVTAIDTKFHVVWVQLESGQKIAVTRHTWKQTRVVYDAITGVRSVETIGEFTQFPLMLAWAITIHKSQGKTLSAVQINISKAFEAGQLYVALSRTKKISDITLNVDLDVGMVKADDFLLQKMYRLVNNMNLAG